MIVAVTVVVPPLCKSEDATLAARLYVVALGGRKNASLPTVKLDPLGRAALDLTTSVPAATTVPPEKVFAAPRVKVPVPALTNPPDPVRAPLSVKAYPAVSKVPLPPAGSVMEALVEKVAPASSVPPPKLNSLPVTGFSPLRTSSPPLSW